MKAYAKINLALDVLEKRGENYHEINSVMVQIELCDELSFEKSDDVIVKSEFKDDIILKTIMKVKELFGIKNGVTVSVKKNIPVGGGFGGGSADAAVTLKALNELWGLNLGFEELIKIGAEIGADVPFCIVGGGCFVSGKGEMVEKISISPVDVLVINPGYGISTKEAYDRLDGMEHENRFSSLKLKNSKSVNEIASCLHNDFIHIQKDDVKSIIKEVLSKGAIGASITGKGPSVFGIFEDSDKALAAYEELKDKYKFVWVGKTIK